ncbi:hypothetical protein EW146_g1797 [Bondarzewia mesenterica]|uniref:Cytochrome P450 n=1 Tax=Bondarzewia mesenterica TaxID=1095465 RepID=A0A4S4M2R7_9AGAM|nr:hypothetical protein EW146_g1797 [Bondarzewia mesenterica]
MLSFAPSFAVLLSTVALAVLARYVLRKKSDVSALPSPASKASWIWGHELEVFEHQACEMYNRWTSEVGPLFKIKAAFFHGDVVVAVDNAAAGHIFSQSERYVKAPMFRPIVVKLLGKGLVWAEGEEHRHQRRLLAPAFSPESVRGMADDVWECAEKFESKLTNQILSHGGSMTINIVPHTSACTLDILGRTAFGHDFNMGDSTEAREISASWHKDVTMGLTFSGFLAPILLYTFPWIAKLPIPAMREDGVTKVIAKKLASRILEKGLLTDKGKDILSLLMKDSRDMKGENGLTNAQILDNIATFIMVGHETTAGSLNFTLLDLARNPEAQDRLRQEIQTFGQELDYDSVQKLEYLDAVVREGLRLHPAAPRTERVALQDDVIPLSKPIRTSDGKTLTSLHVKAGQASDSSFICGRCSDKPAYLQVFHIPFATINVNPDVWGPDGREFKPERWLTPGALPPSSDLPRAIVEFKVILATLIRSIQFRDTTASIRQVISPTLQPVVDGKGGLLPLHISLAQQA